MRVLVLCHEYPPIGGGGAAVCAALAREVAAAGHRQTVVTMGLDELPQREESGGIEVVRVACGRKRKELSTPLEGLAWARRAWPVVRQLHREGRFDITHAHFIMPGGILARRAGRELNIPYLITPHGSDVPGHNHRRLKLAHVLARPWWKSICRGAGRITSPSASLLRLIHDSESNVRADVVPNGFEPGRFNPRAKERRILLCSRLVPGKGFEHFLTALRDLDLAGWEIDVVGDGPMRAELEGLGHACRVPIQWHGWIKNSDPRLAELYGRAMIFAFPSEHENFSISLLEAMSAGCAVLSTDAGGNPEVVGDVGVLVKPRDISGMRQAVTQLTADPNRCAALGSAGVERAALFDWKVIAEKYLQVYHELAGQNVLAQNPTR